MSNLHLLTHNINMHLDPEVAERIVRADLDARPDLAHFQEMKGATRTDFLKEIEAEGDYGLIRFDGYRQRDNVIFYRRSTMELLTAELTALSVSTAFSTATCYMPSGKFVHLPSNRRVWSNCVHIVPGIDERGELLEDDEIRREIAVTQFDHMTERISEQGFRGVTVLTAGDFNVRDNLDRGQDSSYLQARMSRVGAHSSYGELGPMGQRATHNMGWIDAVYLKGYPSIARFNGHIVHPTCESDHRALSAWIRLSQKDSA